jgi:hypothetical protein
MLTIDGTRACEWCYAEADWQAQTANGPRDVCQRHYDEIARPRGAVTRDLPEEMLALVRAARAARP